MLIHDRPSTAVIFLNSVLAQRCLTMCHDPLSDKSLTRFTTYPIAVSVLASEITWLSI